MCRYIYMYISKDVNIDIDNGYISEAWVPL